MANGSVLQCNTPYLRPPIAGIRGFEAQNLTQPIILTIMHNQAIKDGKSVSVERHKGTNAIKQKAGKGSALTGIYGPIVND